MAKNSCTLNLQDFIPYPVQVLPLREFLPRDNQLANNNPNYNNNNNNINRSTACPFDCCQKQFQHQYFPNCELTNAPLRMKIGSAGDRHNKVSGIPCLERRTIFEGRVTEMPMRYEDLFNEAGIKPKATSNLNISQDALVQVLNKAEQQNSSHQLLQQQQQQHQQQQQQQVQQSTGSSDKLKLTFHKGDGGGRPTSMSSCDKAQEKFALKDQYKYYWDTERGGWTFENTQSHGPSSRSSSFSGNPSDPRVASGSGSNPNNEPLSQEEQWRQYHHGQNSIEQRDKRWIQSQFKALTPQHEQQQQQQLKLQEHQRQVTRSDNPHHLNNNSTNDSTDSSGRKSSELSPVKGKADFIEQQLSSHLKNFKYLKPGTPSNTPAGSPNSNTPNNLPVGVGSYKSLNSQSKPNFKPKHPEANTSKRSQSPRAALEQYERLRKYWDYQHQLLGTSMVPYHPGQGPPQSALHHHHQQQISQQINQQQQSYAHSELSQAQPTQEVSGYAHQHQQFGNQWPGAYPSPAGDNDTHQSAFTSTAKVTAHQQLHPSYQPAGPSYGTWTSTEGYTRSSTSAVDNTKNMTQQNQRIQKSVQDLGATLDRIKAAKAAAAVVVTNPKTLMESMDIEEADSKINHSNSKKISNQPKEMQEYEQRKPEAKNSENRKNSKDSSPTPRSPTIIRRNSNEGNNSTMRDNVCRKRDTDAVPMSIKHITNNDPRGPSPEEEEMEDDEAEEVEESPKDLSTGRRNSDQWSLSASPPERSVSTGLIDEYDHIVLLDKRVKSYMCKRCFETLKSEQEIRNHLFCKMLSDTVQCHICRNLFSTDEYTEHLKMHAVKNQKN